MQKLIVTLYRIIKIYILYIFFIYKLFSKICDSFYFSKDVMVYVCSAYFSWFIFCDDIKLNRHLCLSTNALSF